MSPLRRHDYAAAATTLLRAGDDIDVATARDMPAATRDAPLLSVTALRYRYAHATLLLPAAICRCAMIAAMLRRRCCRCHDADRAMRATPCCHDTRFSLLLHAVCHRYVTIEDTLLSDILLRYDAADCRSPPRFHAASRQHARSTSSCFISMPLMPFFTRYAERYDAAC